MNNTLQPERQPDIALEQHFTPAQIAELWNADPKTVRRWFKNEPGVLQWGTEETRYGRPRTHMRIPKSVMDRVHRKLWMR